MDPARRRIFGDEHPAAKNLDFEPKLIVWSVIVFGAQILASDCLCSGIRSSASF
ncbi:hypothetical protein [Roseitranquillus sediminis]|uniref:hypothetical protein n=1 Tax=Roseitranquillus sediminis TaxID=2809051 RepID=UPI001D0C5A8F|nr:hypothetical protein [Roseitranquillus sediminis]MBM9595867.1 hypothetical protein [Roseitranquillus sediminis]